MLWEIYIWEILISVEIYSAVRGCLVITVLLTYLPLDKMATISLTIFSNAFSLMKILYFD